MQVIIPAAGEGRRFREAGYTQPKPMIDVAGKPMWRRVVANLGMGAQQNDKVLLICRQGVQPYSYNEGRQSRPDVLYIDKTTEGALCTVLLARTWIDPEDSLLIANCDQLVDFDTEEWADKILQYQRNPGDFGIIFCFEDPTRNPKWSYAEVDDYHCDIINRIVEKPKDPPSTTATCGIYYFSRAGAFLEAADKVIAANDRTNGEFYLAPVYNHFKGATYVFMVNRMQGLGTPEDLQRALAEGIIE
jgi:NDP-sugar pyrophosphorylase family protein